MVQSIVSASSEASAEPSAARGITVSVVEHDQRDMVAALVRQIAALRDPLIEHVVVTHNLPEKPIGSPPGGWPFRFTELFNRTPEGFGANQNAAFAHCHTPLFCVLNPDIVLNDPAIWRELAQAASQPGVGCAYPMLLNPDGTRQDNEREAITPLALLRRHLLRQPQRKTDWVSAAFWLVPAEVWRRVGGLDERYYMYCEDADFCLRLQLAGWQLARADASAVHVAARSSRYPGRSLAWHLSSMMRHWMQPPLHRYLAHAAKARQ